MDNKFNQIKEHVEHDLYLDKNDVAYLVDIIEQQQKIIGYKDIEIDQYTLWINQFKKENSRYEQVLKEINRKAFDISITKLPQWIYNLTNDTLEVK